MALADPEGLCVAGLMFARGQSAMEMDRPTGFFVTRSVVVADGTVRGCGLLHLWLSLGLWFALCKAPSGGIPFAWPTPSQPPPPPLVTVVQDGTELSSSDRSIRNLSMWPVKCRIVCVRERRNRPWCCGGFCRWGRDEGGGCCQ